MAPSAHKRAFSTCPPLLSIPREPSLPGSSCTTVWGLLLSRSSVTHVPPKPEDKSGPSFHLRAQQEHWAWVLTPSPLTTPPPSSKMQGPPGSPLPGSLPVPIFLAASALIHQCAHSTSGLLSVIKTLRTLTCLSSAQTSPLNSERRNPTWLQSALERRRSQMQQAQTPALDLTSKPAPPTTLTASKNPWSVSPSLRSLSYIQSVNKACWPDLQDAPRIQPLLTSTLVPRQSKLPLLFCWILGSRGAAILNMVSGEPFKNINQISYHTPAQNTTILPISFREIDKIPTACVTGSRSHPTPPPPPRLSLLPLSLQPGSLLSLQHNRYNPS